MARELIHTGRKIRVYLDTIEGKDGLLIRRDLIVHPGAVVILPIIDAENVCLLRNYRFTIDQTLWEVPAGTLEPDEPLEVCAARELQEETGYTAAKWTYLGMMFASPGVMDEKMHFFLAEELASGPPQPEACERLEPVTVPFAEALRMISSGDIRDLKTVSMLLLHQQRLASSVHSKSLLTDSL